MTSDRTVTKELIGITLSIGEIARAAEVAPSAVRFYERQGLITSYRTSGNQRRFHPEAICRIRIARVAQRVGMTVREIAEVLDDLPDESGALEWSELGQRLIDEGRARIRRLERAVQDIAASQALCEVPSRLGP